MTDDEFHLMHFIQDVFYDMDFRSEDHTNEQGALAVLEVLKTNRALTAQVLLNYPPEV